MKLPRRRFLHLAAGVAALPAVSRIAMAQVYPSHPITMIVPFPAGGPYDVFGRLLADHMRKSLGQSVIIENVSGADGSIGIGRAARAKPDGYTIDLGGMSTHVLNGALYSLPYDLLHGFAPIAPLATTPLILFSRNTIPANDLPELIAWLKANPNKASAGIEIAIIHLITALFQKETGTRFGLVPYRGSAPAMQDLLAGHIDLFFDTPVQLPLVRAGSIKAYAVSTDARLVILAPDLPTFTELGFPALTYSTWYGLFAPSGTPSEAIGKLNSAVMQALVEPTVQSRVAGLGLQLPPPERQTPEALGAMVKADAERWWPLIKEFGIKAE